MSKLSEMMDNLSPACDEDGHTITQRQWDELEQQVTLLRDAMQGAWKDGYCFVGPEGQTDEQKAFEQALTTTEPKP